MKPNQIKERVCEKSHLEHKNGREKQDPTPKRKEREREKHT
jgi:hypothetical protein